MDTQVPRQVSGSGRPGVSQGSAAVTAHHLLLQSYISSLLC